MNTKIGITERGDAALDFSWTKKLQPKGNIIISKSINDALINALIAYKDKIIVHITCTGFGGSILEPNVPNKLWTRTQVDKLIAGGFPVKQMVLRVDPIIPTKRGLKTAESVLDLFDTSGIERVRYSFIDMYRHVKDRFQAKSLPLPFNGFCAPDYMINNALDLFRQYGLTYKFEACSENTIHKIGCISQRDFDILGIAEKAGNTGPQRIGCACHSGKIELLTERKKCWHGCVYCYWRN